jgi:molecular chaperone GrpE
MSKEEKNNQPEPQNTELEKLQKQCDEYLNNWKRAAADFANYKKDEIERAGLLVGYAKEDMFTAILPIIDSIYLAAGSFGEQGFMQVKKQIESFLKKQGIEEVKALGEIFNPETMEAVSEANSEEQIASGAVVEELQKGYKIGEKIIRPARVKINK